METTKTEHPESGANSNVSAVSEKNRVWDTESKSRRERESRKDPLAGVKSPLARRYLKFLLPGSRLHGESHAGSIVSSAFEEAWMLTSRTDLTDEQQDSLAEFLMREDWQGWTEMPPEIVDEWARGNLSDQQRGVLLAFIEESKKGQRILHEIRIEDKKREYGVETAREAFDAEMEETARFAELMSADTDNLSPEEVEKMRQELQGMIKEGLEGRNEDEKKSLALARREERSRRLSNHFADLIPMTEDQQIAVYDALVAGSHPPTNTQDYRSGTLRQAEAKLRSTTEWMNEILTDEQYKTYLRHFLAEIEMSRFRTQSER